MSNIITTENLAVARTSKDNVQDVLNRVGNEVSTTSCEASALEDVNDVVHHDVHTRQLRPHLQRGTEADTTDDSRLDEVEIRLGSFGALKFDLAFNFGVLELHKLISRVTLAVQVGKDLECFSVTIMVHEPTGRLNARLCESL